MANLRYEIKGKGISSLYVRFYKGNEFRCQVSSGLMVPVHLWNNKSQKLKKTTNFDTISLASNLNSLKSHILSAFNQDYTTGEIINSKWLKSIIQAYHKQDNNDTSYKIYFCDYVRRFIDHCRSRVNLTTGKKLAHSTILKYENALTRLQEYEADTNAKLKHSDINTLFYKDFVGFLSLSGEYGSSTIKKYVSMLKTFCKEAELEGISIHPSGKNGITVKNNQHTDIPYLHEAEIQHIFNLDLSKCQKLENVRDMFIVQLWTGLRISDLKRLTKENIKSDSIEIVETKKTDATVKIPIHPMVQQILDKRNGILPKLCSSPTYNKKIKVICKLAKIDKQMIGTKVNPETKRKEKGFYPKYELITSHTARRSFITNLYQKVSDETLKSLSTHKSNTQFLKYVKITQDEHFEAVKKLWKVA